jgi:hypothetical protein
MDLAGAVVFVLQYDDYRNDCQCEKNPLLKTVNRVFGRIKSDNNSKNCSLVEKQDLQQN